MEQEFIEKLEKVQERAEILHTRGWSDCRLCQTPNGSAEYRYNGWAWPEGYMHYLVDHRVHPSKDFRAMIEKTACLHWNDDVHW